MYTRLCAFIARTCLKLGVGGLVLLVCAVLYQVIGRYIFNDTPTWAESGAVLLVLYVVLGSFALKRARTPQGRVLCYVAALAVYGAPLPSAGAAFSAAADDSQLRLVEMPVLMLPPGCRAIVGSRGAHRHPYAVVRAASSLSM